MYASDWATSPWLPKHHQPLLGPTRKPTRRALTSRPKKTIKGEISGQYNWDGYCVGTLEFRTNGLQGGGWWAGYHYCGGWAYEYGYAPHSCYIFGGG
jgi:hypothetical protein